jgi:hypothetical protein
VARPPAQRPRPRASLRERGESRDGKPRSSPALAEAIPIRSEPTPPKSPMVSRPEPSSISPVHPSCRFRYVARKVPWRAPERCSRTPRISGTWREREKPHCRGLDDSRKA